MVAKQLGPCHGSTADVTAILHFVLPEIGCVVLVWNCILRIAGVTLVLLGTFLASGGCVKTVVVHSYVPRLHCNSQLKLSALCPAEYNRYFVVDCNLDVVLVQQRLLMRQIDGELVVDTAEGQHTTHRRLVRLWFGGRLGVALSVVTHLH